jgi:hypothetical protein
MKALVLFTMVLFSQVPSDSGTIYQQTWEIFFANKCLNMNYKKFMPRLKKNHFIFLLVLELLIYYMLGYVKNIVALNAIYLDAI